MPLTKGADIVFGGTCTDYAISSGFLVDSSDLHHLLAIGFIYLLEYRYAHVLKQ